MSVSGWAVRGRRGIFVNTVSSTRRGAIVNWMVAIQGGFVANYHTDEQIEKAWQEDKIGEFAEVIEVEIVAK